MRGLVHVLSRVDPRWSTAVVVGVLLVGAALQPDPQLPRDAQAVTSVGARGWVLTVEPGPAGAAPHAPTAVTTAASLPRAARSGRSAPALRHEAPTVEQRGRAALRALPYEWRRLGYAIHFRAYDGTGLGTANRRTRTLTVYVRPRQSELTLRASIAHELAHALDFEHGTTERRDAYRRIRGLSRTSPWFPCERCEDFASPAGDFAEVFAAWLVGTGDFRSRLGGPPTRRQLTELRPLFAVPATRPAPSAGAPPLDAPDEDDEDDEGGLPALLPPPPRPGQP